MDVTLLRLDATPKVGFDNSNLRQCNEKTCPKTTLEPQGLQCAKRLCKENQRLAEEYMRLLNVYSFYDQDSQALMEIGNEVDDKAKEAETMVHNLEVGFGLMIRDHNDHVRRSSIQSLMASFSPRIAEAIAIFQGMVLAVNFGLLPLVVESDAKFMIDMINGGVTPQANIGVIIHDILSLLSKFHISLSFVPR
ncbi:hypothetical protein Dsin_032457 [Dipteronia sinensis]|uniref:RNase H type-1 domain-containing protein n=1 Tax=Dipteronia sinensis TaxID=43782 RepID=A0AAD9ZN96_9ROSI|nr:hypothetical protein Dsin_032457 [Dipteronia sinensis]